MTPEGTAAAYESHSENEHSERRFQTKQELQIKLVHLLAQEHGHDDATEMMGWALPSTDKEYKSPSENFELFLNTSEGQSLFEEFQEGVEDEEVFFERLKVTFCAWHEKHRVNLKKNVK